jgi:hypothetical protein
MRRRQRTAAVAATAAPKRSNGIVEAIEMARMK